MAKKSDGALGLVIIEHKGMALKAEWPFRIQHNAVLKALTYYLLNNIMGDELWQAQLDPLQMFRGSFVRTAFW